MPQGCLMGLWKKKLLARPESCRTKRADSCARRTPGQPKWSQSKAHQARKSINLENVERRSANLMCHCPKVSIDSIPSLFGQRLTNLLSHTSCAVRTKKKKPSRPRIQVFVSIIVYTTNQEKRDLKPFKSRTLRGPKSRPNSLLHLSLKFLTHFRSELQKRST